MERTKYFLFLLTLQCPPSLLIPLAKHDIANTTIPDNLVELGTNHIVEITPNNSKVNELIQQIDVKDTENNVISNIKHVAIYDETNDTTKESNGQINAAVNKTLASFTNVTSILNNAGETNLSNGSHSLLLTNTSNNTLKAANLTVHQDKFVNGTQTNALISNILPNSTIVRVGNGSSQNATSLNTNLKESINLETVAIEHLNGENILPKLSIDDEAEISWRIDSPVKEKTKIRNTLKNDNSNTTILSKNNNQRSENNDNNYLLESNNNLLVDEKTTNIPEKNIFLLLNTGNIDGISVNSPDRKDNLQTNLGKHVIENVNPGNSKLLNDLVNSTINNLLSNILQRNHNHNSLKNKHLFLILNSGSISNVHVESPVLGNIAKNTNLKARSRRHLNDTNNTTVESVSLKPLNDESSPIIEIKSQLPPDNTTVDEIPKEEISGAEAPAFRSMISDKVHKLQNVSNAIAAAIEPKSIIDHNLLLKLIPGSPPIDLHQIPLNNLLGDALSFIKRLKRNTVENDTDTIHIQTNEDHTVKAYNETKSNNDLKAKSLTPTRKSLAHSINNALDLYQRIELVCPLNVIVNLYTKHVLGKLAEEVSIDVLHQMLSSIMIGKEGVSDFAARQLSELPIKLKLELHMLHGKTKEFIEQLNNNVDAKRCSVS